MDSREAREILMLYRPGTDAADVQFAEALAQAARDPELAVWLDRETAAHAALASKLAGTEPPPDLWEKILLKQPVAKRRTFSPGQVWQLAATLAVFCGLAVFWYRPAPQNSFGAYERYLGEFVARPYRMSLESGNLDRIRSFLANNQAPSDYALSAGVQGTNALGCATLSWNGNPVSMLCFSDAAQHERKLFLFVVARGATPDSPEGAARRVERVGRFSVAGWTAGGRSYVLAVEGDERVLVGYL